MTSPLDLLIHLIKLLSCLEIRCYPTLSHNCVNITPTQLHELPIEILDLKDSMALLKLSIVCVL
jgi:hypothetical protein